MSRIKPAKASEASHRTITLRWRPYPAVSTMSYAGARSAVRGLTKQEAPSTLERNFGMAWGIGGWLLPAFLAKIGMPAAQQLRERVAAEIKTTFASHYTERVSLRGALDPAHVAVYGRQATGEKYLIEPQA